MAGIGKRTLLRDVNPHLICPLCRGYLIDATTVVECLHSFCRSCILKHLRDVAHCPSCKNALNKAKPNIKADKALQDIVYKLVPGLYHKEMLKRREFYKKHPEHANSATPEQRGEDVSGRLIFSPEDVVSLSLEYSTRRMGPWIALKNTDTNNSNSTNSNNMHNNNNNHDDVGSNRRYLQCPALVTVAHLKKFLALKYSVDVTRYTIEICHRLAPLPENWTLIDVAYIYPWKRNAPMRLFYRVAKEQKLEAPSHQRPSTPGLGARDCLPPNTAQETSKSEVKSDSNSNDTSVVKELNKKKDEANKTTTSITTTTNTSPLSTTVCKNSNKQIKSPIKILKNPDGKYEVQKSSSATVGWNEKEQAVVTTDTKNLTNPEFSVVNSNGVKITLKQRSPPQNSNSKKPKIVSNVLLSCSPPEEIFSALQSQQQQNKSKSMSPVSPDKQEKQRRKVTFVDRLPMSEKTSPSTAMPKTALKRPAEQQDKKQFLQGFQLTAREPSVSDDSKVKSPVRDTAVATDKFLQKTDVKMEEFSKNTEKSNNENVGSKTNNNTTATNVMRKRVASMMSASNAQMYANKIDNVDGRTFSAGTNSKNIMSGNHATKLDVYTFSNDAPILPAGAVKRKCPPGVPIADLKRRKTVHIAPKQNANKKQNTSLHNSMVKQSHISSAEHVGPTSRAVNIAGDYGNVSRVSNANIAKTSTDPLSSNDTRDFLVDGYGLNIPASLSITLTSPKSPGTSKQFVEPNDSNDANRKVALGKVNPSITLNNKSVDPRVLKALKTGQMKMPTTPAKAKSATMMATMDRNEATNQQRTAGRQKREHESSREILDLSGGNKKVEIHPLRIPQPVTKLNKTNKVCGGPAAAGRSNMQPGGISDQGQVVTLLGGHRYYRAPPGSLTPAAHRVNDCPLPPVLPRTPVYAPSLCGSVNRSNSDLSSVFPSLPSLYALHQAPNLQQFQMDTVRLRIPESSANPGISGMAIKSHLAAQCAPIKPARSAPLAVPATKHSSVKFPNMNVNCMGQDNVNKPMDFHSNEGFDSTDEVSQATVQKRFSSDMESTNNKFFSPCKITKSNDQATVEIKNKDLSVEARNESNDTDNSMMQQQQQQQQHREAASPSIVSSTASPSPPPGNGNGGVNARNEESRGDENINNTSGSKSMTTASSPTKSNVASEVTCSKSPVSPDSSSVTVESSGTNKSCSTDREMPTDSSQTVSDAAKTSDPPANSHDSSVDDSSTLDDKKNKSETNEITKQLTSEMVQKRLLAVFPSNEWANNPIAAEHLGNFLKSLNATMKSEEHAEGSKAEKIDRKPCDNDGTKNDNDASVKSKKDVERS